jgi:branched-chain amino acid transport system substrate-binding protein
VKASFIPHRSRVRALSSLALLALLAACAAPDTPSGSTSSSGAASSGAASSSGVATSSSGSAAASVAAGTGGENDCENVQSDIRIGASTSLTGGTADLGEGHRKGMKLAIKEYNEKGGYQGKKVRCIILDDATKPEQGLANTTRLVNQDNVVGMVSYTNTGIAVPATKQLNDAGVPVIVPVSTGTNVTAQFVGQPDNCVFRLSMPDVSQVQTMLQFMEQKGLSKPAIMHDVTGYGKLGADDITKALAAKGMQPVTTQSFQIGDTDMTGQLTQAKNAGADVVMTYALAPELANLLKSMDRLGWYPPVVGSWTLGQPDMIKLAGEDIAKKFDIYMVQSFTIDRDDTSRAFHQKVEQEYGAGSNRVPITAAQGYDATNIMLAALDKAGPDRKAICTAIGETDNFKGVTTAPVKPYGPDDHEAIEQKDMFIGTWKEVDGKMQIVKAQQ